VTVSADNEASFLWTGFLAKCELRQLLDELYEGALLH
jgi:hypothetical protein